MPRSRRAIIPRTMLHFADRAIQVSHQRTVRCAACRALETFGPCHQLFDKLLALDHSATRPWGPLHGVATACYFLHHPIDPRAPAERNTLARLLREAIDPAVPLPKLLSVAERQRFNELLPAPISARDQIRSIQDLSLDGTFPAAGYAVRLRAWAAHILSGWRGTTA
jgi:hypothetical protein